MANPNFESSANNKVELAALKTGDQGVGGINFRDVMQPDLHDAVRQSDAAVAAATQRLAAIHEKIGNHFGHGTEDHKDFLELHNQYYEIA